MDVANSYINANHLIVSCSGQTLWWIGCQGPLESTVADFWQMVWEQGSQLIVMVASLEEGGRTKCHQYWPNQMEGEKLRFGNFDVVLKKEKHSDCYVTRGLRITHVTTGEARTIWHLQFTTWPDHGLPGTTDSLLDFCEEVSTVRKHLQANAATSEWPTVVHCSAGIGRSGVFMLTEAMRLRVETGCILDLREILVELREQRPQMVQTAGQYKFCFQAAEEFMQRMSTGSTTL